MSKVPLWKKKNKKHGSYKLETSSCRPGSPVIDFANWRKDYGVMKLKLGRHHLNYDEITAYP